MVNLAARYATVVILTRGRADTLVATQSEQWVAAVQSVNPLNTTGSGDACTAGLVAVLAHGGTLREAVEEGHRYGARNAELVRPGTIR
jgi:sugar/nucleoside kinase (ribokinase family)